MELSFGRLGLINISFSVSEDALANKDMLTGLPELQHLCIDLRTLFERSRAALDGTDCSAVAHPSASRTCDSLSRLMIVRHQRVTGRKLIDDDSTALLYAPPSNSDRPRENYFAHKSDEDPFPDPNLMDVEDKTKDDAETKDIEAMNQHAIKSDIKTRFLSRFVISSESSDRRSAHTSLAYRPKSIRYIFN